MQKTQYTWQTFLLLTGYFRWKESRRMGGSRFKICRQLGTLRTNTFQFLKCHRLISGIFLIPKLIFCKIVLWWWWIHKRIVIQELQQVQKNRIHLAVHVFTPMFFLNHCDCFVRYLKPEIFKRRSSSKKMHSIFHSKTSHSVVLQFEN